MASACRYPSYTISASTTASANALAVERSPSAARKTKYTSHGRRNMLSHMCQTHSFVTMKPFVSSKTNKSSAGSGPS